MPRLICLCLGLLSIGLVTPTFAQGDDGSRIYMRYTGSSEAISALEGAAMRFERVIHQSSEMRFAGTTEMETVYAQCAVDVGASASEQRECQLQAARRIFVDFVFEVELTRVERGQYELIL